MATTVTVTAVYVNRDWHEYQNTPVYAYSANTTSSSVIPMTWTGTTAHAVGTYGSPTTIVANSKLIWDGTVLQAGSIATPSTVIYGSADYTMMLGSKTVGEYGGIELVANQTSNDPLGMITWHNVASSRGDTVVGAIYVDRYSGGNAGYMHFEVADSAAQFTTSYSMYQYSHVWAMGYDSDLTVMRLTNDGLTVAGNVIGGFHMAHIQNLFW